MTKDDLLAFTAILQSNMISYWDFRIDELITLSWFDSINTADPNCTVDEFRTAMTMYSASEKASYRPQPYSILSLMPGSRRKNNAWESAEKAVRSIGRNRSVTFEDTQISATILKMGGWINFCKSMDNPEQFPFIKKEFMSTYSTTEQLINEVKLIGAHETNNNLLNLPNMNQHATIKRSNELSNNQVNLIGR